MLGQPAVVAGHDRGDAQGEALLAEQGVAPVAGAVAPDLPGLREVDDVLVVGVARPRHVGLAVREGRADGVQARHPLAVAERVEGGLAHPGHDPHAGGDVGGVGQLDADVGDGGAERAHREGDDVHRPAPHGASVQRGELGAHLARVTPVVVGTGVGLGGRADEGAILHPGHVTRVGVGPVAVGSLRLVERRERPALDQAGAEPLVLLERAVAPVHVGGLEDLHPLGHPVHQPLVGGGAAHR